MGYREVVTVTITRLAKSVISIKVNQYGTATYAGMINNCNSPADVEWTGRAFLDVSKGAHA